MKKSLSCLVLVLLVAGCQGQSSPSPATASSASLINEPLPPELAAIVEEPDLETALARIDKLIQVRPTECLLYSVRSSINHRHSRNQAAVDDLDQAISMNDRDPRLFNNRGYVRLGMQMFNAAASDFDRATELNPAYANPYNNRGLLLIARGQHASAVEQFDEAIRLDPNYIDAYNNRGFAALQAGNVDRAVADFNTAIKLNPRYVNAYSNRGLLRLRVGDLDNAIIDFTQAMIIDPMNPKYYEHRREVYLRQSAIDLALVDEARHDWLIRLQEMNAQLAEKPANTALLLERSRHYMTGNDPIKASQDLERALKLEPRSATVLMEHGRFCIRQNDYAGALADADKLMEFAPSREVFSLSGDAYLGLKSYDKAIECFAKARRIDAAVAEAYLRKAEILQAAGREDQAADTLKQAVQLNPSLTEAYPEGASTESTPAQPIDTQVVADLLQQAQVCLDRKDYSAALEAAEKVLELTPSEKAFSILGDANLALKSYDNAIEWYAKSRRIDAAVAEAYFGKSQQQKASGQHAQAAESLRLALSFNLDTSVEGRAEATRGLVPVPSDLNTTDVAERLKKGRECLKQKDFAGARTEAESLLETSASLDACSLCGDAYLGLKDYDKAIEYYAKARRIDAAVAEAYYRKSQAYKSAGQHDQAAEALKYAISLDPQVTTRLR